VSGAPATDHRPPGSAGAVSLVVTDLDGTFWHTDDHIDQAVLDAVERLAEQGVPLLVATGRRLASTRAPLARVGLAPPAVVLNGALGVDLTSGERFHCSAFTRVDATAVLDALAAVGLAPVVYVDHHRYDVFLAPEPSTHPDHVVQLGASAGVDDLDRVGREETVLAFSMIGVDAAAASAAADAIGALAETHVDRSLDFPGRASFTCAPRGQSKWDGVLGYCSHRGVDPTRVLALADGPNDVELLDNAAIRLVPDVAHPAAKARADHVIPAAAAGGWCHVLDHLG